MFKGIDYYDLESGLSSEARMIRDSVRDFVDKEFLPIVRDHYRAGGFPMRIIPMLGEMGLLGSNLKGFGLPGIDQVSYGLVMQELERGDSGLRSFASVQGALVMYPIHTFGSEAQ
ncbi:MAG: acyl-CoA dehydrogenase family protein, partial [Candidatus Deferrimicrobiaceae bacterium]